MEFKTKDHTHLTFVYGPKLNRIAYPASEANPTPDLITCYVFVGVTMVPIEKFTNKEKFENSEFNRELLTAAITVCLKKAA